jgi:hypothetical protein
MKHRILTFVTSAIIASACSYEFPETDASLIPSKGEADFTKTVSIGSSLAAGFMNGALYNDGQHNSFSNILAYQFALAGGGDFNQPDINAVNGYYGMAGETILGRLHLKGNPPTPSPKIPGDAITAYAGDKSKLNNFGAYGVTIQTAQLPALGGPTTSNPYFNPYYGRFASNPGTSTLLGDAVSAMEDGGTFLVIWLGTDDVLGHATNGADQADVTKPLTEVNAFTAAYGNAINQLLGANTSAKGIVANIPNVTSLPHFTTVPYNPIPLDATTAGGLSIQLAANYNGFLDAMVENSLITSEEAAKRKLTFSAGQNAILIEDESLTDLSPYMSGEAEALKPYKIARQTTAEDMIPMGASSIIGTKINNDDNLINGVTVPLADKYALTKTEIDMLQERIDDFN